MLPVDMMGLAKSNGEWTKKETPFQVRLQDKEQTWNVHTFVSLRALEFLGFVGISWMVWWLHKGHNFERRISIQPSPVADRPPEDESQ